MKSKDLLIVYNVFGENDNYGDYLNDINSIFWHINKHKLNDRVRFVISAVLKSDEFIENFRKICNSEITIFRYEVNLPVQVTFNKTVLSAIDYFDEEYEGYLYSSSYFIFPEIDDLLPRILEKIYSKEYGIIHLYANSDNGAIDTPSDEDRILHMGCWANLNAAIIHRSLKDFYGRPLSDIHGKSSSEQTYPYICAAIRKKYILLGNSTCKHIPQKDSRTPMFDKNGNSLKNYMIEGTDFLWGLSLDNIKWDWEGLQAGLGYMGDHQLNYKGGCVIHDNWIQHDVQKYDENILSIDERLKYSVKRNFFVQKDRFDYNSLIFEVI